MQLWPLVQHVQVFEEPRSQPADPSKEPVKMEPPAADAAVKVNGPECSTQAQPPALRLNGFLSVIQFCVFLLQMNTRFLLLCCD